MKRKIKSFILLSNNVEATGGSLYHEIVYPNCASVKIITDGYFFFKIMRVVMFEYNLVSQNY